MATLTCSQRPGNNPALVTSTSTALIDSPQTTRQRDEPGERKPAAIGPDPQILCSLPEPPYCHVNYFAAQLSPHTFKKQDEARFGYDSVNRRDILQRLQTETYDDPRVVEAVKGVLSGIEDSRRLIGLVRELKLTSQSVNETLTWALLHGDTAVLRAAIDTKAFPEPLNFAVLRLAHDTFCTADALGHVIASPRGRLLATALLMVSPSIFFDMQAYLPPETLAYHVNRLKGDAPLGISYSQNGEEILARMQRVLPARITEARYLEGQRSMAVDGLSIAEILGAFDQASSVAAGSGIKGLSNLAHHGVSLSFRKSGVLGSDARVFDRLAQKLGLRIEYLGIKGDKSDGFNAFAPLFGARLYFAGFDRSNHQFSVGRTLGERLVDALHAFRDRGEELDHAWLMQVTREEYSPAERQVLWARRKEHLTTVLKGVVQVGKWTGRMALLLSKFDPALAPAHIAYGIYRAATNSREQNEEGISDPYREQLFSGSASHSDKEVGVNKTLSNEKHRPVEPVKK